MAWTLELVWYPEQFWQIGAIRLGASCTCLLLLALSYTSSLARHPLVADLAPAMIGAVTIEYIILRLGGPESPYYAGLNLVILGASLCYVWSWRKALCACGAVFMMWAIPAFPELFRAGANTTEIINNFYFLFATTGIVVSAMELRYRGERREFEAKRELAGTSAELATALERAKEVDRMKSEFFANISHELRTPLTLILSPVDELLGRLEIGPERDALRVVRRNAVRLLRLIDDLLALAKLEAGGLRLRVARLDLNLLASRMTENAKPAAEAKGIELVYSEAGEGPEVFGDPDRVEIILSNLIGNAMKFTPAGGRISVTLIRNSAGSSIEVADSGPGISREEQARIFERFHQGESSERRKQGGAGIGLALARELAQLHGGSLSVESTVGEGSTFTVFLKSGRDHFHAEVLERRQSESDLSPGRRLADQEESSVQASDAPVASARTGGEGSEPPVLLDRGRAPRILVAEDEDDLRAFVVSMLGRHYRVDAARNGAEALAKLNENRPDLVLTDLMMPQVSGLDLTRAIKQDPSLTHIPVILLTAKGESEAALDGYEAGADDFVAKPFHSKVLQARIRAHLKMRGLSMQLADQARLASAGTLAAGLAHEVKNPLNAAVNAARVLRSGGSSKVTNDKLLAVIVDALDRIDSIVSALNAHARPADGDDLRPCRVHDAVDSTLNLLEHKLRYQVTVHKEYRCTADVVAPARAFNQVLLNLVDNAIRAGGSNIWIDVQQHDRTVSVSVSDDGPGVPPDMIHRIFDPFFTTRAEGEGTGLGLHLSRRIARECGGELRYESRPGGGARFVIEIPAMEQAA